ncbi:Putative glycosyltransferase EpsD [Flavobacterium bizetiae]|uniref:Glycosyltransferase EpsD n=1 Tax=Flavobacterium bizetiae TaxID=2704140 RepID=A0A6J4GQD3_9FLAO|nr:glycosyltransferase [Flavobacterium bizetiae]CAA9199718.1 Putative glycosyltransferase EpsD [Flavobacterium bizetiae]CAD5343891.1 Putative glycosyltransferase EpsD [Flavobacterium bizetiae]CAD5349673.1 Putative glycosyltransferase EpsD [Flavobacterium bizetiae]
MSKIKIAHILHSVGGVDVSLRQILQNIDTLNFENIVLHGDSDTQVLFEDKNSKSIKEYQLPIHRKISIKNDYQAIVKALKIIRKEQPDLIHSHSTKGGVIARIIGFITDVKVLHTPQAFSYLSTDKKIKRITYLFIEKILSKGKSVLLASSESELKRAIDEVGYSRSKTALFNNAITPIEKIYELSIPKTWPDKYLCTVGRPCYQKNTEELVRVMHELNKTEDIHLVLIGVGHHADQLEIVQNLVLKLNLKEKVTILNWTSREDVLHIISKAKLYISASRYEGLPYAVIESLALSIPNVVSDCDGNRDLIKNDYNGFCVKNDDTQEFSQRIIQLLKEENLHYEFSKNAKETFLKHHNIKEKINNLESIYREELK